MRNLTDRHKAVVRNYEREANRALDRMTPILAAMQTLGMGGAEELGDAIAQAKSALTKLNVGLEMNKDT